MKKIYNIDVDCPSCANKMEFAAAKVSGINEVSIDFMTLKMIVDFNEEADEKKVMEEVLRVCRKVERHCEIYF